VHDVFKAVQQCDRLTVIHCRVSVSHKATARLHGRGSKSTDNVMEYPSDFCDSQNISFSMVASVDARTLPLALLQSDAVYVLVADMSQHSDTNGSASRSLSKMNSSSGDDISFDQLMVQLAWLQRMLVSVLAGFQSNSTSLLRF